MLAQELTHTLRHPDYPVDPLFPERWSPRSMSGAPVGREILMILFEAARWAPSSNNNQPWRYCYALNGGADWPHFFDLLTPGNQAWCRNAGALIVMLSKTTFDHNGKPAATHSFDAGAAWMSLALQGNLLGLVVHGMQGFDYVRARVTLELPEEYVVEAMCAVGQPAPPENLPENMREREKPNQRNRVDTFAFEGRFPG